MINRFLQGFMGRPLLTFAIIVELLSCCLRTGTLICLSLFNHWSEALGLQIAAWGSTKVVYFKQHLNAENIGKMKGKG